MEAKTIAASRITLSRMMGVQDANMLGNVHGVVIMKMVDEGGALAAMRHAQCPVVTVAVDSMTFQQPIRISDVVTIRAELTYVGRTSMEVWVQVFAEHPFDATTIQTNSAYVVYVAINEDGKPREVPPLKIETDEERERWARAEERQRYRKSQQNMAKR